MENLQRTRVAVVVVFKFSYRIGGAYVRMPTKTTSIITNNTLKKKTFFF